MLEKDASLSPIFLKVEIEPALLLFQVCSLLRYYTPIASIDTIVATESSSDGWLDAVILTHFAQIQPDSVQTEV